MRTFLLILVIVLYVAKTQQQSFKNENHLFEALEEEMNNKAFHRQQVKNLLQKTPRFVQKPSKGSLFGALEEQYNNIQMLNKQKKKEEEMRFKQVEPKPHLFDVLEKEMKEHNVNPLQFRFKETEPEEQKKPHLFDVLENQLQTDSTLVTDSARFKEQPQQIANQEPKEESKIIEVNENTQLKLKDTLFTVEQLTQAIQISNTLIEKCGYKLEKCDLSSKPVAQMRLKEESPIPSLEQEIKNQEEEMNLDELNQVF